MSSIFCRWLALQQETGYNPFKLGMVGTTDTHSATPGGAGVDPFAENCAEQAEVAGDGVSGTFGDVYGKCCLTEAEEPFFSPVIQERAWTSPIWYTPVP